MEGVLAWVLVVVGWRSGDDAVHLWYGHGCGLGLSSCEPEGRGSSYLRMDGWLLY